MSQDIIAMAREAGAWTQQRKNCDVEYVMSGQSLERFATLVAAAAKADERDACAKVCYELPWKDMDHIPSNLAFAAAIRAR